MESNFAAVSSDVNTYVGYSLFSLKRKHGVIEEMVTGIYEEDKYWLLSNMMFLARGGKQASQSLLRDTQKHSGLEGKNEKRKREPHPGNLNQ